MIVVTSDYPGSPQILQIGKRRTLGDKEMFEHSIANMVVGAVVTILGAALAIPFFIILFAPFAPGL